MKAFLTFGLLGLMVAGNALAQERTAGQSYDAQVNWSALQSSIDLVSTQNKALAAIIDKMQTCNGQKKIYAPGDSAADSNGCVAVSGAPDIVEAVSNNGAWSSKMEGTATCPSGTVIIGGSCDMYRGDDGREISPRTCKIVGNGFYCNENNAGHCIAHAVCAKK